MGKLVSSILSKENLDKLRSTGIETFLYVRKGGPAHNTRSRKTKFIYESMGDVSTHLKTEWKKYLAQKMYRDIVNNKNASMATKLELREIYYSLK